MPDDTFKTNADHGHEITARGLVLGVVLTTILAAANVFMGLRSGITFSSSIPAAVMSMGVLRALGGAGVLENNIVQTQASAAGTLCNVILVLPALTILGIWHGFPFWQTMLVCLLGGWYGVLFSIPLRRTLVLQAALPYPEGVAAAEVLRAGQKGGGGGLGILGIGAAAASVVNFCTDGVKLLAPDASVVLTAAGASFRLSTGYSLALVGVGYLVGVAACVSLLVGVLLAWGVFVPWLTAHGNAADPARAAMDVWTGQVRMVGAGIIAVGAIWSIVSLYRPMVEGLRGALRSAAQLRGDGPMPDRIDRDVPIGWVGAACVGLSVPLAALYWSFTAPAFPQMGEALGWSLVIGATLFTISFGFLMATACGYMAGLLGSSSSPISGIAILAAAVIALLMTLILPGQGDLGAALSVFVAAVIVTTSSIANDNLQDLKTGAMVDATPWRQQLVLLLGVGAGAVIIAVLMQLLFKTYGFAGAMPRPGMDPSRALAAPQASLVGGIVRGIFHGTLPWNMVLTGMGLGVLFVLFDTWLKRRDLQMPVLTVGIGVYLPPTVGVTIAVGGILGWLATLVRVRAGTSDKREEHVRRRGVLLASGFLVGESLTGVCLALIQSTTGHGDLMAIAPPLEAAGRLGSLVWVLGLAAIFGFLTFVRRPREAGG